MEAVYYNEPLVSIVIPVYNAEKCLERCLNSVLSQDYKNIEIILIDDGSRDSCPEICDRYKGQNPGIITFVRQENGGPSIARNNGIELSRGKYVAFVDADDMVTSNMISTLVGKAEIEDVDMVICSYWTITNNVQIEHKFTLPEGLYANGDQNKILYSLIDGSNEGDIRPYSWIRFTRKSVFEEFGLRFSERLLRSEDYHFWVKVHSIVKKVYLLSKTPLYYYIENNSSITHNHTNGYWECAQYIHHDLKKILPEDAVVSEKLDVMLIRSSLIALNNAAFCRNAKEAYREIIEIIKNEELNQIIKRNKLNSVLAHKQYRFLMSNGLKGVVVFRYMMRWLKSHKKTQYW